MTRAEFQACANLIRNLRYISRDLNRILIQLNRSESFLGYGLQVNDQIPFKRELQDLKNLINIKNNRIRNEIIPNIQQRMMSSFN